MAIPLITNLPPAPSRLETEETFVPKADALLSQLPTFVEETNTSITGINNTADQVTADKATTGQYLLEAETARDAAISSSVYRGTWEGKTSVGVIGESYSYQGSYIYRLNVNLANILTSVPSPTNTDWQLINVVPFEAPCKPTLDLDFANQDFTIYDKQGGFVKRPLADIVSQGRATAGGSTDAIGGVTEVAAGENRFEFNPVTGEALGYLSEESRTRLNTIYIAPTVNENITTTAQSYTISMWGAGTITLSGTYSGTLVGVDEFTRVTLTFAATAGTLTLSYSGACLNVQLEAGSFATSLIQGVEGTAIARAADAMTRTLGQEWNPNEGTFVVEAEYFGPNSIAGGFYVFNDGTANNRIGIYFDSTGSTGGSNDVVTVILSKSGVNSLIFSSVVGAKTGFHKVAMSFNGTLISLCIDGVFMGTENHGGLPLVDRLDGQNAGLGSVATRTKYLQYYPRAFDILTLQRLSRIQ